MIVLIFLPDCNLSLPRSMSNRTFTISCLLPVVNLFKMKSFNSSCRDLGEQQKQMREFGKECTEINMNKQLGKSSA